MTSHTYINLTITFATTMPPSKRPRHSLEVDGDAYEVLDVQEASSSLRHEDPV